MRVAIRSYKELRRYYQFGQDAADDAVWKWMNRIEDCQVLYDVGSANGLEGMLINHLHGSLVVFIEPFTPSIETILKSIVIAKRNKNFAGGFEVVHAAIDEKEGYNPLLMHEGPVPGATGNTFADPTAYARGGREDWFVPASQWVKSVTLDCLNEVYGLPLPTHVKIDIDGFEDRAMRGATRLLTSGHVRSWAIELNGDDNVTEICALMAEHGYVEVARWEHYPGYEHYTGDHIFVRKDLAEDWARGSQ